MVVWIDAQLAPTLAGWLRETFGVDALAVRDLQLRDAEDSVIFQAARDAGAVVLTKDADFVTLVGRRGAPPQIVWLTCGNTSNRALRELLTTAWPRVVVLLEAGEPLVEISARAS
jgi:predicted nuclease of predicted toxin-antitoxin system